MSLADITWFRDRARTTWQGLRPPSALPSMIWRDLQWHRSLYQEDRLPLVDALSFLILRVVQRLAYNLGWYIGGRS